MSLGWSEGQARRLKELDAPTAELERRFPDESQRNRAFQELEETLVRRGRAELEAFRTERLRPRLCALERKLADVLAGRGFAQVATPILMSRALLARMGIGEDHPLAAQVYWVERNRCLRPMLAPHLYYVLRNLLRLWPKPVRIFEVGPCFRKETQGARHASEFTMLNVVEMGVPEEGREARLEALARLVAEAAGLSDHRLVAETSEVYGHTVDVVAGADDLEVGSAAVGPHPLDGAWGIMDAWIGIGFGLERLLLARDGTGNLSRWGRSLSYLDGVWLAL